MLTEIQHPFILSPILADFDKNSFMVVREFLPSGSLRDLIYEKTPKATALAKYLQPSRIRKLSLDSIKQYGRQVRACWGREGGEADAG